MSDKSAKIGPCTNCPWKRSTHTVDIPGGGMKDLTLEELDSRMTAMGCHRHPDQRPKACAGFMVRVGFRSVGVRLATLRGVDDPENYTDRGCELYDSFDEMIQAHKQGVS